MIAPIITFIVGCLVGYLFARWALPSVPTTTTATLVAASELPASTGSANPISLNAAQEQAVKEWAADDRLWTTQETVEFNLRTFARVILKADSPNEKGQR